MGMMSCEGCGSKLSEGHKFCNGCGRRVIERAGESCRGCGKTIGSSDAFCRFCGCRRTAQPVAAAPTSRSARPRSVAVEVLVGILAAAGILAVLWGIDTAMSAPAFRSHELLTRPYGLSRAGEEAIEVRTAEIKNLGVVRIMVGVVLFLPFVGIRWRRGR